MTKTKPGVLIQLDQKKEKEKEKEKLFRIFIVLVLVLQSCSYVLYREYIQTSLHRPVNSNVVLMMGEGLKFVFSLLMIIFIDVETQNKPFRELMKGGAVMLLPAFCYLTMNLLSFVALKYISGSLFITIAQLKTLTTAVFSVIILGNNPSFTKWASLFILVSGSILVTFQEESLATNPRPASTLPSSTSFSVSFSEPETTDLWSLLVGDTPHFAIGLSAVCLEVTISGFMSVYFENILKFHSGSIWERNLQLSFLSLILYFMNLLFLFGTNFLDEISFVTPPIVITAVLGAAGGILVALCIKYIDSVAKCVVLSFSVLATIILSHFLFYSALNEFTIVGATMVISGCLLYNQPHLFDPLISYFIPPSSSPSGKKLSC